MSAPRSAQPTIRFVDEYCQLFESLFSEVRSFEAFKLLHLGMISEIKRKSLPAIASSVGLGRVCKLQRKQDRCYGWCHSVISGIGNFCQLGDVLAFC